MNIFKIKNSPTKPLTRKNFEDMTNKKYPYYRTKNGKTKHYALCPICGNPVVIVNLYNNNYIDLEQNRISLHARHCRRTIPDLAVYNELKYNNCQLRRITSFGKRVFREDNAYNEKLKNKIESNRYNIRKHIRKIVGINVSNTRLDEIIDTYLNNMNYRYYHTNEFNIPYSIVYTSSAINVFKNYIYDNEIGYEIKEKIQSNSIYFLVNADNQIVKKCNDKVYISVSLYNHVKNDNKWYMALKLVETCDYQDNVIFKTKIEMEPIILDE